MRKSAMAAAVSISATVLVAVLAGPAHAEPQGAFGTDPASTTTSNSDEAFGSTLTITRAGQTTVTTSSISVAQAEAQARDSIGAANPDAANPAGAYLYCDHTYNFSDSNNTYTISHACGGTTGPWGIKFQPSLCAIITSEIVETGMNATRNGKNYGKAKGHTYPCSFTFHGTYNPDKDGDHIAYADTFAFSVGDDGQGTLQVHGSFTTTGSPCSPTAC